MKTRPLLLIAVLAAAASAHGYPEFQAFIEQHSGRNVNCAMCHAHPDGPEGLKPGQIGSLKPEQLDALNRARSAFEPGQDVQSPILNEFGNAIMRQLGKQKFLEIRQDPAALPAALDPAGDLDGDGIPDAKEYLAGTLPTDPNHGDPWTLFKNNLRKRWFSIVMISLATAAGVYGLGNLVMGFEAMAAAGSGGGRNGG